MSVFFKYLLVLLSTLCFIPNAIADNNTTAMTHAVSWINGKQTKVAPVDVETIVSAAFEQGAKHKIDPFLILALIKKESTFNKKARNKSKASGLMQVIPFWHRDKINGRNIFSVKVNVEVGTQILKDCLNKYSQKIHPALKCYSGGASNKYMREISLTQNNLRKWVTEQQFISQQPLFYAGTNFDHLAL